MNLEQAQTSLRRQVGTRMQGRWLVLARMIWVVVLVLAVGIFIINRPYIFADAHLACASTDCNGGRLTLEQIRELHQLGLSLNFYAAFTIALSILLESVYVVIGVVIFWRRSDERMALLSSLALITFSAAFRSFDPEASLIPPVYIMTLCMAFLGNCCMGLFLYLFPTGRFVPRWIGWLALGWIVYWGIKNLVLGTILTNAGLDFVIFLGLLLSVVATQVYRYRRLATLEQRQQTKWVVYGISLTLSGVATLFLLEKLVRLGIIPELMGGILLYIFLLLIPLSIGIAILRTHLWDIDILINRTLVYAMLSATVIVFYILVVGYLSVLFRTGSNLLISLIATGLVAVLFQPLRAWLQRGVNRLLYGQRDEPYTVITGLSRRLEATIAPDAVLPAIVETVAQALKLPYAAILLKRDDELSIAASYGQARGEPLAFPLTYQRESIGKLLLAPRRPGEDFTPADRHLLNELTLQVSLAAHTVRLTSDLQRSNEYLQAARAHLVTTREEERRRLRQDLHDGLGPTLAALTLKIGAARKLLSRDTAQVERLLLELNGDIESTVGDIRRLVYNLRPPTLDELGLVGAIRERASQYTISREADTGNSLRIEVEAPEHIPALPAAVEVAAYRIVQEALTNVVRHAHARLCRIRLTLDEMPLSCGTERAWEADQSAEKPHQVESSTAAPSVAASSPFQLPERMLGRKSVGSRNTKEERRSQLFFHGLLIVEVCDDGVGIDSRQHTGIGIRSMRERATELGGSCSIEPAESGGTRVLARLPLMKE